MNYVVFICSIYDVSEIYSLFEKKNQQLHAIQVNTKSEYTMELL